MARRVDGRAGRTRQSARTGIATENVIGHNESLDNPFYRELDPSFRGRTHGDFRKSTMRVYRRKLKRLGGC